MTKTSPETVSADPFAKLINPQLAQAALNSIDRHGDFKAYVKLKPRTARPAGYRPLQHTAGLYAASIPCGEIEAMMRDSNVVSVELREYVTH